MILIVTLCVCAFAQPRRRGDFRRDVDLKAGDAAPDFNLKKLHGEGKVTLSSFKGKRPVVLIFGSYT